MKKEKPSLNSIVAKNNSLISKMAKFDLSELRLIAYCVAHYDSRNPENRSFTARVDDLTQLFPMDHKSAYAVIRKAMLGINKKPLEFKEGNKRHFWNWFSGFTYTEGSGEFEFRITPEIQPYLLALKGTFTKYRLIDVYQFKAASTWKVYELLKQWEPVRKWTVELEELRLLLGVAGKYPVWKDFHQRIIKPSIAEINKVSDLSISYEKEKRGRTIVGLIFFIDTKQPEDVITIENPRGKIFKLLLAYGVNEKTAHDYTEKISRANKIDLFVDQIPIIKKRWESNPRGIPLAKYMIGAIKNELQQQELPFGKPKEPEKPVHTDALECWQKKRRTGEQCAVRQKGTAGQQKKCQICLEKLPVVDWGI